MVALLALVVVTANADNKYMIHIALRTEYSFKQTYSPIKELVEYAKENEMTELGIADIGNTFGHFSFNKQCKDAGIKPIFGVRLNTLPDNNKQRTCGLPWIYLAKNNEGLKELYRLTKTSYDKFYYTPRIFFKDSLSVSENIAVLSPFRIGLNALLGDITPSTLDYLGGFIYYDIRKEKEIPVDNHNYLNKEDREVYQVLAGVNKRGDGYIHKFESKTYPQHLLTNEEHSYEFNSRDYWDNAKELALECNAELNHAEMVKAPFKRDIVKECEKGAKRLDIDLSDPVYEERINREISIIKERGFTDYFFIVSDMLIEAKKTMLVGPGRGSSGGSLVCYLLGITEIDPIEYGLIFERFVDLNRIGLPDIDTDIPDVSRQKVIKYLIKKYGEKNVNSIGTISVFKAKSALTELGKSLGMPKDMIEGLKDSIIERQGGDDRADMCIEDTFTSTEIGKKAIEDYPDLYIASKLESHANHAGKHAAGVIIANDDLTNYTGVDNREGIIMSTGKEAEALGLLKIDVLGLRTLSVLEETARLANFDFKDYYKLNLNDKKVFEIFNDDRVYGIFQFEGSATRELTRQITVDSFDDLCSLTALSRPGALISGEAARYVKRKNGYDKPVYYGDIYKGITEPTYGAVVFQEQGMALMKDYAGMSWVDVNTLRQAISKSYGIEFFMKYKEIFSNGAKELGRDEEEIEAVWDTIASMGSYSFNKSHSVGYSLVSYWTAYCKAYHPLEFAAANMNNSKDDDTSIKILRDFVINDGIEYIPVDPDVSNVKWSIYDGKLIGGLTNIDGIGEKKAQDIIKRRSTGRNFTPAILKKMMDPKTPFDILFPTQHHFGHYFTDPVSQGLYEKPHLIKDVNDQGNYIVIGKVKNKDLIFRNSPQLILKRQGKVLEDNLYYLKLIIEDDTSDIMCQIAPFRFDELNGQHFAESLAIDKSWVIIKGSIQGGYRMLSIEAISVLQEKSE